LQPLPVRGADPFVDRSICGRRWQLRAVDETAALTISQRLDLPEIVGRVLASRGVSIDAAPTFLRPRIRDSLPDPSHLLDLDVAVERLADAIDAREPIGILADYDVDGASSAALLSRYLCAIGASSQIDVPDRLLEGYGPNPVALERLAKLGCRLVVTVDSGTTAFEALGAAAELGQEVIVVDHHVAEPRLPAALAVINPNRCDQDSALGHLAAVGVTFLLIVALNRTLRARGHFAGAPEPDLRRWLDLVALGTVCDVVPLTGLNRAFVAQGLRVAARGDNPGIAQLAAVARIAALETTDDLGFALGPRLNAGGRVGHSALGAQLLASEDLDEVAEIAARLDLLNRERRATERQVIAAAEAALGAALQSDAPLLLAAGAGWSPGVVGLAAARLVERYHRPAVVIGLADGIGKGSGRSVAGFDLGAAVIAARNAGILSQGGGHPMAAGLTVAADRLDALAAFLTERVEHQLGMGAPAPPDLTLDGALQVGGCSVGLARRLASLAPYGRGNPEPRFAIAEARPWRVRQIGDNHVDCWLQDAAGARLRAVAFRALDRPLGQALLASSGTPMHFAGRLKLDRWNGEQRVTFQIEDAAAA
jgi:single-stranded-DNA-specific exonuclease